MVNSKRSNVQMRHQNSLNLLHKISSIYLKEIRYLALRYQFDLLFRRIRHCWMPYSMLFQLSTLPCRSPHYPNKLNFNSLILLKVLLESHNSKVVWDNVIKYNEGKITNCLWYNQWIRWKITTFINVFVSCEINLFEIMVFWR